MIKKIILKMFCRHRENYSSSCPFTGNTYTYCELCGKRISFKKTKPEVL